MHSFIFISSQRSGNQSLTATGVARRFSSAAQAQDNLSSPGRLVVGALPFHQHEAPFLFEPESWTFSNRPPQLDPVVSPQVDRVENLPNPARHKETIAEALAAIAQGSIDKIVLSRAQRYYLAKPLRAEAILASYMRSAGTGYGYLSLVGEDTYFVGPSPEILISKRGKSFESFPLAGTAPRSLDPAEDQARADRLNHSEKDHKEHGFVTEGIREVLEPLSTRLEVPARPELLKTTHTWHLGTRISGELKQNMSALELARLLHPTAAVNGYPAAAAQEILARREPDRGFYGGAVGWSDSEGNGEWRVGIRSALVTPECITAYAGGGIVKDSTPQEELAETSTKLGPIRSVLELGRETLPSL